MPTKLHPELRRICRRRWSVLPSSHRWLKPESRWAFSACQGSGSLFYPALPNLSASTPASGSLGSPLICRTVSKSDTFVIASQHLQIDFAGCRPASRSRSNNEAQANGNAHQTQGPSALRRRGSGRRSQPGWSGGSTGHPMQTVTGKLRGQTSRRAGVATKLGAQYGAESKQAHAESSANDADNQHRPTPEMATQGTNHWSGQKLRASIAAP